MEKEEQFKWQNKQVKTPLINFIIASFLRKKCSLASQGKMSLNHATFNWNK